MHCLDVPVWVALFDAEHNRHAAVRSKLADLLRTAPLFLTTPVQLAVVDHLQTHLADSEQAIDTFLRLEDATVAHLTQADVRAAGDLQASFADQPLSGREAALLAACRRHGVDRLWTDSPGAVSVGERVDWLQVTDPLAE